MLAGFGRWSKLMSDAQYSFDEEDQLDDDVKSMHDIFKHGKILCCLRVAFRYEIVFRMIADFIVNGMLKALVMYTFPILLCVKTVVCWMRRSWLAERPWLAFGPPSCAAVAGCSLLLDSP